MALVNATDYFLRVNDEIGINENNSVFKAMNQLDHVTSVIAITVCKVIQKIKSKMDFPCQTDVNKSFSYQFFIF